MRKRWKIGENFLWILYGIWILGWLPLFFLITVLTIPCKGGCGLGSYAPMPWQPIAFICVWFGVVLVPAALMGARKLAKALWRDRPRRVVEPVVADLRELNS